MIFGASVVMRERVELARVPEGGPLLLAIALVLAGLGMVVWLYRREGDTPIVRKVVLGGIRVLLVLAVIVLLLDPVLTTERVRDLEGMTVVLVDESSSMGVPDRYPEEIGESLAERLGMTTGDLGRTPRHDVVTRLLEGKLLDGLASRNPVRVLGFAGEVRSKIDVPRGEKAGAPEFTAEGTATDLAAALRAAMEGSEGRPTTAVVLISDGRSNRGEDPTGVAEALARRRIALHAVGIGDPSEPRNAAVADFAAPKRVLAGEPFKMDVRVRATGVPGEETRLTVARRRPGAKEGETIHEQTVRFPRDGKEITIEVEDRQAKPAKFVYEARLAPLERETTDDDNRAESSVEIINEKVRLLLVAGGPGREYRALRALFTRDKTVELSCWLQSADVDFPQDGNKPLRRLPDTAADLFEFDVVLLIDVTPTGLGASWMERLNELVRDRGGGLAFVAGPASTLSLLQGVDGETLRRLLPVKPDLVRAAREQTIRIGRAQPWPVELTREGQGHALTRLDDSPDGGAELWASLPGLYGAFPVDREKPGAVPLLRSADPRAIGRFGPPVVLAAQWYGSGRSLFMGTAETWRWRSTAEDAFDRFWLGAVRFLTAGRLGGGRGRLHVETDRDVYAVGERIEVRARALDPSYEPVPDPFLSLAVREGDRSEWDVRLTPDPTRKGWFRGFVTAPRPGWLELSLAPRGGDAGAVRTLKVARPDRELADVRLDRALLGDLAKRTGGSYIDPGRIDELVERIGTRRERLIVPASSDPLWDRWWTLFVLAGLLTSEWILRKWSGLT